jgi:hypothetical protein
MRKGVSNVAYRSEQMQVLSAFVKEEFESNFLKQLRVLVGSIRQSLGSGSKSDVLRAVPRKYAPKQKLSMAESAFVKNP